MILRCDFGSELVRQDHGNDMVVSALSKYCDSNPVFRVWPVAPHSQSKNKAENSWGRVQGGTFMNGFRARVGRRGWSLMQTGAEFQHNHTNAPRARAEGARLMSRSYALTQKIFDVSTMLGYVGQGCWAHKATGKANPFRPRARAGAIHMPG
jgi:hypothetical protein